MNLKYLLVWGGLFLFPSILLASDASVQNSIIQDAETERISDVFADIYEKLDSVKWAGKNIDIVIESLESLNPKAHIAATGERIVLVWGDELVGN